MPETRRECFPSSNIKADLMFARRETGFRARYQNTNSGILTTLTNETEWGYNTVHPQRTSSRLIRERSALALVQSRISMMRRARVHCFVNIMDQWHVIDTYRRGMMAGAAQGRGKAFTSDKITRVSHRASGSSQPATISGGLE